MGDLRRRDGKLKILHTIIGDFGKTLRTIAENDAVDAILTGTISPSKSYKETLTFQYFTDNGIKLLAKTTTAVQEIFIVTNSPELLLDEMAKSGFLDDERKDVKHFKKKRKHNQNRHALSVPPENDDSHEQALKKGKKNPQPNQASEEDPLTLRQVLDKDELSALIKLKEQMTKAKGPENSQKDASSARKQKQNPASDEEDFASLFAPEEDEESFAELFKRSNLDPKFFK